MQTHWELLCRLHTSGWKIVPFVGRKSPEPLSLEAPLEPQADKKFVFFNKGQLDVNFHYLACLNSLSELKAAGHKELQHRAMPAYYKELLGLPVVRNTKRRGVMDDACFGYQFEGLAALQGAEGARGRGEPGQPRALQALEDGPGTVDSDVCDGEPEEADADLIEVPVVPGTNVPNGACTVLNTFRWGSFEFSMIERQRRLKTSPLGGQYGNDKLPSVYRHILVSPC